MSNAQAFLLGVIAAWTPCLLILAWFVRRAKLDDAPRTKQVPANSSSGGYNGSDAEGETNHHPEEEVQLETHR
jgi:hypothetical protein